MSPDTTPAARLLIVDDNPAIHEDFRLALCQAAPDAEAEADDRLMFGQAARPRPARPVYALEHALSGQEGIDKLKQALTQEASFQVAFVDIRMPGMDGVATIEGLWQSDPRLQVVICTAYADYSWEELTQRLGHTDKLLVLKKPFDDIEVNQAASTLAEKWFLARQAELKLEHMERLVAQRTRKVLELQRRESQQLHERDQEKLRFVTQMANEFRSPLTLILGPLEQALAQGKIERPQQEMLHRNAQHLLRLLDQLTSFERGQAGEPIPENSAAPAEKQDAPAPPAASAPAALAGGAPENATAEDSAPGKETALVLLFAAQPDLVAYLGQGLPEYRWLTAKDAEQALAQAQETVPDLIILDLDVPRSDGLELCRRLKGDELTSHVPIILLTARASEELAIQALGAGADDSLVKPFRLPLLKARLENLLQSHRKLLQRYGSETTLEPRDLATNPADVYFLRRLTALVEAHLADLEFDVETLVQKMHMSRRQLFRKLKAVAGCTPNGLIRAMRLQRAAHLLAHSEMTVTDITYAVGFSDLKYFRTLFRDQFGVLPGEYAKKRED